MKRSEPVLLMEGISSEKRGLRIPKEVLGELLDLIKNGDSLCWEPRIKDLIKIANFFD